MEQSIVLLVGGAQAQIDYLHPVRQSPVDPTRELDCPAAHVPSQYAHAVQFGFRRQSVDDPCAGCAMSGHVFRMVVRLEA
jgi:hypothetical protein